MVEDGTRVMNAPRGEPKRKPIMLTVTPVACWEMHEEDVFPSSGAVVSFCWRACRAAPWSPTLPALALLALAAQLNVHLI